MAPPVSPDADLTWSLSFYCPSQCLLSAPRPVVAKPLETVMPAHTLARTWTFTGTFTELAQEAQSLDSVGPLPTLPPNFLLELL